MFLTPIRHTCANNDAFLYYHFRNNLFYDKCWNLQETNNTRITTSEIVGDKNISTTLSNPWFSFPQSMMLGEQRTNYIVRIHKAWHPSYTIIAKKNCPVYVPWWFRTDSTLSSNFGFDRTSTQNMTASLLFLCPHIWLALLKADYTYILFKSFMSFWLIMNSRWAIWRRVKGVKKITTHSCLFITKPSWQNKDVRKY